MGIGSLVRGMREWPRNVRAYSRAKKGFPSHASYSRVRVYRGSTAPSRDRKISPIAPRLSGPSCTRPRRTEDRARPMLSGTGSSVRNVSRIKTGSACRRRKQNSSTAAEARSIHCASSTAMTSGAPSERTRIISKIPRARIRRSGSGLPAWRRLLVGVSEASRRSAISTALLRGVGSARRISSATSPNRSSRAEKASGLSARVGWHDSTLDEQRAAWSTCCHITVLPIPASPVIASAAGVPDPAERNARISAISASRPTGHESTYHPRIGSNTSGHR